MHTYSTFFFLTASDGSLLFSKKFELFVFRGEPSLELREK